ncbi:MAG: hypothetical protein WCS85_05300 [Candidatus Peribacteraceae bacterium]|jgi:hypothetical protein
MPNPNGPVSGDDQPATPEQIRQIAELEQKYANQGVSILAQDGVTLRMTEAVANHVLGVFAAIEDLKAHPERIHHIAA